MKKHTLNKVADALFGVVLLLMTICLLCASILGIEVAIAYFVPMILITLIAFIFTAIVCDWKDD